MFIYFSKYLGDSEYHFYLFKKKEIHAVISRVSSSSKNFT